MSTVFIGGSRRIARLNDVIRARLDNIVERGLRVVIGDANGSDRAVQAYLAQRGHRDIVVYCMAGTCRNNLGDWNVQSVEASGQRGLDYYALKDAEMAGNADCGFMIWNGKSKGTLLNVQRLLETGKPVVVYFSPDRKCTTVRTPDDLKDLLARSPSSDRQRLSYVLAGKGHQSTLLPSNEPNLTDRAMDTGTQERPGASAGR